MTISRDSEASKKKNSKAIMELTFIKKMVEKFKKKGKKTHPSSKSK